MSNLAHAVDLPGPQVVLTVTSLRRGADPLRPPFLERPDPLRREGSVTTSGNPSLAWHSSSR